jgi:hypothetical protein
MIPQPAFEILSLLDLNDGFEKKRSAGGNIQGQSGTGHSCLARHQKEKPFYVQFDADQDKQSLAH